MGGLQRSDLIVLAGRPAMGKTSLATNIAYNVAKAHRAEGRFEVKALWLFVRSVPAKPFGNK